MIFYLLRNKQVSNVKITVNYPYSNHLFENSCFLCVSTDSIKYLHIKKKHASQKI